MRGALLVLAAAFACACSSSSSGDYSGFWSGVGKGSDLAAPAATPRAGADVLSKCPTAKCLVVYVAPWCPHCREAVPTILAARDYLKPLGVDTRVIVGLDKPRALADYAKTFGPDTMIDQDGALGEKGVPRFLVTDARGNILRDQPGFAPELSDPKDFAAYLGLP